MLILDDSQVSQRDTALAHPPYLQDQLSLGVQWGSRRWVHQALRLRVAERRADRDLAADIIRHRHGLGRWPCPPKTLILTYLAELAQVDPGEAGAAALVMVALLPGQYHVLPVLGVAQYEALTLVRLWRAQDLGPQRTPDLTPETLRRVVRGERSRGPLRDLRSEWMTRKCREGGLRAAPRLLCTYADPEQGHDGAVYLAAGARFCGRGTGGKLLFCWALDSTLQADLDALAQAVAERGQ